jgi:hypothetical protein
VRLTLEFDWRPVGAVRLDPDGRLRFPSLPAEPGLYMFRLSGLDPTSVYIGETDNLRRRLAHYRNPGPTQFTNIRINERLRGHLATGAQVKLCLITAARQTTGEQDSPVPLDLTKKSDRRLVENAALVLAAASGADEIANL